jgi:glyoxylase-like metal-dependent hydrolase (beta-lactamase superfamily II)
MTIHHLNCGILHAPPNPAAACHCLLIENSNGLILIDTGIGLRDVADPIGRIGKFAIEAAGFQFDEQTTAIRQIEKQGFRAADVRHIILTHGDPDHVGGLADFPQASVHLSQEEHESLIRGNGRYSPAQIAHGPNFVAHSHSDGNWFGIAARPLGFEGAAQCLLIPLFGHTRGHCGVAVKTADKWLLHVGDAYYLRAELTSENHPVSALAAARADDNDLRLESLGILRRLAIEHPHEVEMCGYHDFTEFPQEL